MLSSSLTAALQRAFPVSSNAKQDDCHFQPLRAGIYILGSGALVQYYDPDLSDTSLIFLSRKAENVLEVCNDAALMLANDAAVTTSDEVGCFWQLKAERLIVHSPVNHLLHKGFHYLRLQRPYVDPVLIRSSNGA